VGGDNDDDNGGGGGAAGGGQLGANARFYTNVGRSLPDELLIEELHERWTGDNEQLERAHGYIQWLFPVFENKGMNWQATKLSKADGAHIRADLSAARRVVASYRLMLDFYGTSGIPHRGPLLACCDQLQEFLE